MNAAREHRGHTLVELLAVLAVLGVIAMVSGLSLVSLRPGAEARTEAAARRLRATAIRTGQIVRDSGRVFFPDGRALGPGLDPLTGLGR